MANRMAYPTADELSAMAGGKQFGNTQDMIAHAQTPGASQQYKDALLEHMMYTALTDGRGVNEIPQVLAAGADINAPRSVDGDTHLTNVIKREQPDAQERHIDQLLKWGANPSARNADNTTSVTVAQTARRYTLADKLQEAAKRSASIAG